MILRRTHFAALTLVGLGCGESPPVEQLPELPPKVAKTADVAPAVPVIVAQGGAVGCPPGMVRVRGEGAVGMKGQPYGIVQTQHMDKVDSPERLCPQAVAATPGASACWVQTDLIDPILRKRLVTIEDFCIERAPFPGVGAQYPTDGMTAGTVALLDEMLKSGRFGPRRLCTATEYQLAVAGPKSNLRFVYGDTGDDTRCAAGQPIGRDGRCQNPETGVLEYGAIHSHWVRADAAFVAAACDAPPCKGAGNRELAVGAYVVMGGTNRAQTRQAPLTPHTWHDHGEPADVGCGDEGWDDQVVICSDPDEGYGKDKVSEALRASEVRWAKVVSAVRGSKKITSGIGQGLGRPLCGDAAAR